MKCQPAIITPERDDQIVRAYLLYLHSVREWSELLPTEENAKTFAEALLIPAWRRGEPILFAALDRQIIGATFTTLPDPKFQYRIPFASGHGTWVAVEWRNHGVAKALLQRVREMLKERGVTRQVGLVHEGNEASRCTFLKLGFVPHSLVLRYDIPG